MKIYCVNMGDLIPHHIYYLYHYLLQSTVYMELYFHEYHTKQIQIYMP